MLTMYPACFYKEKEGGYSVIFPKLNIATYGDDFDQAMKMAIDCLAGYVYNARIEGGKPLDPPKMEDIDVNIGYRGDYENAFVNMVTVDVDEYAKRHFETSVKKTLTIPAWLNDKAMREGINFSQTLQNALKQQLNIK